MVPCSSTQLMPKLAIPSCHKWRHYISTFPSHPNCPISTVFQLESVLSRLICFKISAFTSKAKASYKCRKSIARKTLPAAPVDTFCRTLIISFFTILPLCKPVFGSAVCTLACGSTVVSLRSSVASSSLEWR